jgi:hypothetical protein
MTALSRDRVVQELVIEGRELVDPRLAEAHRADVRLRAGTIGFREVGLLGRRLAAMQVEACQDAQVAEHGLPEALRRNVQEAVLAATQAFAHVGADRMAEIERKLLASIGDHEGWLRGRARRRRIVSGHGDLRLTHVYLDERGGPRIVDCLEPRDDLRCADAVADVAMLALDLDHRGQPDLAEHLIASWAEATGDYDAYRGLEFYTRYRALLRARDEAIVAADASVSVVRRDVAGGAARRLFTRALGMERRSAFAPRVIAVGGIMASGKSTLAAALAERLGAPRVSTDRTRKQMLGVEPSALRVDPNVWRSAFAEDLTEAVYDQMLRRAESVLHSGRAVVLDATFRTAAFRRAARALAERNGAPFVFIECAAPPQLGRQRLRDRERSSLGSDGRLEIFDEFVAGYERPDELPAPEHVWVDTAQPFDQSLSDVLATVPSWP